VSGPFNPPLRVARLIATKRKDPERGTKVWMNREEAEVRLLTDGELVWVYGPRRHELAVLTIDEKVKRGECVLRDVAGASPSEIVTIVKVSTDKPRRERGQPA
jgi:anaerobic selenocysteine-containing dehydrogenase